ncbi:MAG: tRNA(Ile)-lysidine synthetase, partial [Gammaproteobacteria bacterium]
LERAAALQQEAAGLLEELAMLDLSALEHGDTLMLAGLRALSPARRNNLLRHWALRRGLPPPPPQVLARVGPELLEAGEGCDPVLQWGEVQLRRYRDRIHLLRQLPEPDPASEHAWDLERPLELPGGVLSACPALGEGLRRASLGNEVKVGYRRGGERLRPRGDRHRRSLKKLLQGAGLPPWRRPLLPLVRVGDRVVAVADRWLEHEFAAGEGEEGVRLHWRPRL